MKRLLLVLCALALVATVASADVPDPSKCATSLDVPKALYLCPDGLGDCGTSTFTVTVKNASGLAINNAVVEVLIGSTGTGGLIKICATQTLTANTNVTGNVTFNIAGGGCNKNANAAVIRANGVDIRNWNAVMSSDYTNTDNVGAGSTFSDKKVTPADFSAFVACYKGGTGPASCHDYNNSGLTGPEDFALFVGAYKGGTNVCP
jgi:hypothetical protein